MQKDEKISIYSYVSDMLSVKTLGVNTPLHVAENNKTIAHIEATRNQSYKYPVLSTQEWITAQDEVRRVSQAIQKNHALLGKRISSEEAAKLYPVSLPESIAEYAQEVAYQNARKIQPSAEYSVQLRNAGL